MRVNHRLVLSGGLAATAGVALAASLQIPVSAFDPVGARVFPVFVSGTLLALSLMLLFGEFRAALADAAPEGEIEPDVPAIAGVFASFGGAIALVVQGLISLAVGLAGIILFGGGVLMLRAAGPAPLARGVLARQTAVLALTALALAWGSQLVFVRLLGIPLP